MVLLLLVASLVPADPCSLADTLFCQGFYPAAATEYKRDLYLRPDSDGITRLKLGLSLGAAGETESAVEQLRETAEQHPEMSYAAGMAVAGFLVECQDAGRARLELLDAQVFAQDSVRRSELSSALAWLDLAEGNEAGAAKCLEDAGNLELAAEVRKAGFVPGHNPTVAALLSTFVPGAGETYAGRPITGLTSLLVTGGSAAGVYMAARSDDWVTAAAVFSFLFLRFYNGSRSNASNFCSVYREKTVGRRLLALADRYGLEPDWFAAGESLTGLRLECADRSPLGKAPSPVRLPAGRE